MHYTTITQPSMYYRALTQEYLVGRNMHYVVICIVFHLLYFTRVGGCAASEHVCIAVLKAHNPGEVLHRSL